MLTLGIGALNPLIFLQNNQRSYFSDNNYSKLFPPQTYQQTVLLQYRRYLCLIHTNLPQHNPEHHPNQLLCSQYRSPS